MKKFILIGAAVLTIGATAPSQAADLPLKAVPIAAAYNWTGWYVGLNVGGAWGHTNARTTTVFDPAGYFATTSPGAIAVAGAQKINSSGVVAGGQIGHNWQTGNMVYGVETDFQYFGLRGSSTGSGIYPCCAPTGFTVNTAFKTNWLFTARPRIGWAANTWLFYVTGGLAVTQLKGNFTFSDTFATAAESGALSVTKVGWTAGVGAEGAVSGPWTVKLEYLHVDFGTASTTSTNLTAFGPPVIPFPTNPFTHSVNLRSEIVRVGLNYQLH